MLHFLTKVWRWLRRCFSPSSSSSPLAPNVPPTQLSDSEYDHHLLALLEAVNQGATWPELQAWLMVHNLKKNQLAQWLEHYSQQWLQQPQQHQELGRRLSLLGRVATGELGRVACAIGAQLSASITH